MSRAEVDLQISVRKACSTDEVPPKRKHVRACIVYTWDHKNSRSFWNAVKIQPLQGNEVLLFKALIMIHKVLQEGHPNTLKDGYRNRDFLFSLLTVFSMTSNYGLLINRYDKYLLQKLDFHRDHSGFNGMFEYEEYISLRHVNDPNEGYEAILLLMDLQDSINDMQKHIFSTIHHSPNNLCKVSALVPFISESYGIYKFLISMLRAMYQQLGEEALSDLFDRFNSQHFILREFYTDCQPIKFLTSLITIPRIPSSAPDLRVSDENSSQLAPPTPAPEPISEVSLQPTLNIEVAPTPPPADLIYLQQTGMFNQQFQMQQQEQAQLEYQRQQQLQEQQMRQQAFEQEKLEQQQRMLQEQEALRQQQTQAHTLRVSELEQDLLLFKSQFDNDQALLAQYDSRVKSLESEMATLNETATQQIAGKDEQIKLLEDQVNNWAKKYESLAKLYSQLRAEHLNLLAKFKKIQQKILSAQESVLKKEKLEKDLKSKNLELADLIRERDRARLDLDRVKATKDQEIEKLETQIRDLGARANELGQFNSTQLTNLQTQHQEELNRLNTELAEKSMQLTSLGDVSSLKDALKNKDVDLEIMQESLDMALEELALLKTDGGSQKQLLNLLDVILANNVRRIQDAKFEFTSTMQAGNINATPEYVLSIADLCADIATDFALAFNGYLAEASTMPDDETYSSIVLAGSDLTSTVSDLMLNAKGLCQNLSSDDEEQLVELVNELLAGAEVYFLSLTSDTLDEMEKEDDKIDFVIDCNISFQEVLQLISTLLETLRVSKRKDVFKKGNIEDVVDYEMNDAAKTVTEATDFLTQLMSTIKNGPNIEVHELLLSCALAITKAVAQLILNATECQTEIVARNKGQSSRREFYKKNSRWTEGLISASKAVGAATNILIQSADGVLKKENSLEQVIVACNEVSASTAQLVTASRVKSHSTSKTLERLEGSSGNVNGACKALVSKVQQYINKDSSVNQGPDLSKLTPYEGKTLEMEQQVEILKLENSLNQARKRLTEIRKYGYKDDHLDDEE
ncbi:hypothetical protein PUMCH_001329 [Australozyma saopauloensis]|uniref:Cytoskeleton assembly control protein n=1 Tax=Australozyma saopauloensis TaxID=291208 RepID=A0AAX4H6I2_9ASCO|nr:hypothetical protein PUMCH_001329 [[Candida] saopauloensis]